MLAPGGLRSRLEALALIHADTPRAAALDQHIDDATRHVGDATRHVGDATRHVGDATRAEVSTRYVEGLLVPAEQLAARAVELFLHGAVSA